MSKEASSVEDTEARSAMKLALDALNNSVDLVVEDAYNAEKLYGNYPTRQGKVGGLKVLAENHKEAIKALEEALAGKQEQGEPVAWRTFDGEGLYFYCSYEDNETYADVWNKRNPNHKGWVEPLYTTPQQQKPLEPTVPEDANINQRISFKAGWKAAEAAHGIKE
jgi:hypothetical protein